MCFTGELVLFYSCEDLIVIECITDLFVSSANCLTVGSNHMKYQALLFHQPPPSPMGWWSVRSTRPSLWCRDTTCLATDTHSNIVPGRHLRNTRPHAPSLEHLPPYPPPALAKALRSDLGHTGHLTTHWLQPGTTNPSLSATAPLDERRYTGTPTHR